MTYKQSQDIFFYGLVIWLIAFFGSYYILRWQFRRWGKSARNLELKVFLFTFIPCFAVPMLTAPKVPIWVKIILITVSIVVPILAWRVYVRNFNTMRRGMGLREWDWDRAGPKQENRDSMMDNKENPPQS